jgi:hypothetical protein
LGVAGVFAGGFIGVDALTGLAYFRSIEDTV